jgi:hypothetical protein
MNYLIGIGLLALFCTVVWVAQMVLEELDFPGSGVLATVLGVIVSGLVAMLLWAVQHPEIGR